MFQQEKGVVTPSLRSKDAQRLALPGGFAFFFEWPQDMVNLGTSILGPQQV